MGNNTHDGSCIVCGGRCAVCASTTGWRKVACSPEHYEMFLVLREHQAGTIETADALQKIRELRYMHDVPLLASVEGYIAAMEEASGDDDASDAAPISVPNATRKNKSRNTRKE